jgi:hypothetical protein
MKFTEIPKKICRNISFPKFDIYVHEASFDLAQPIRVQNNQSSCVNNVLSFIPPALCPNLVRQSLSAKLILPSLIMSEEPSHPLPPTYKTARVIHHKKSL